MIETKEIKLSPNKMLYFLFMEYGMIWALFTFIGLCIFLVLGFTIDYRFFILSLLWIFLVIPLLIAFLYFYYGLAPITALNCLNHKILMSGNQVMIRIIENQKENTPTTKDLAHVLSLNKNEYYKKKSGSDCFLFFFHQKGILWLPYEAFDSQEEFKSFLSGFQ